MDINHHVIHSLCALLLFPLVPVEEYYNNQDHSQQNQPSDNCNDCNSRLHSTGSWLRICCIVSGESCIHNSRLNNQVTIMYTSSQIRLFIAVLWLYMFLSPSQYCKILQCPILYVSWNCWDVPTLSFCTSMHVKVLEVSPPKLVSYSTHAPLNQMCINVSKPLGCTFNTDSISFIQFLQLV